MEEISYSGANSPIKRKLSKRLILFSVFFVIILLLLGSVAYFVTSGEKVEKPNDVVTEEKSEPVEVSEAPTEKPSETKTPTPSVKVSPAPTKASSASSDKSSIEIAIQNGSGEAGVAGGASSILKAAGYTIASTGNAENFDYTGVTIQVKATKKSILTGIEDALNEDYTVTKSTSDLPSDASYDALVIIGK